MKRVSVSCTDLEKYFTRQDDGQIVPRYTNVIVDLADYPPLYYPYTDFPCRNITDKQQERAYDIIIDAELFLSKEQRYSRYNGYKALLSALWHATSDTEATQHPAKDVRKQIIRKLRLLPNPRHDASGLLREEFAYYRALFEETLYKEEAWTQTRQTIATKILDDVWSNDDPDNPLPWSDPWTMDQIVAEPYEYWPDDVIWTWNGFWEAVKEKLNQHISALNYLLILRWLQWMIIRYEDPSPAKTSVGKAVNTLSGVRASSTESDLSQVQRALYYVYLHITNSTIGFETHPQGKVIAIKELANTYGGSWKTFQTYYNQFYTSIANRTAASNARNIHHIIALLDEFPLAKERALDELKTARHKQGNPLT